MYRCRIGVAWPSFYDSFREMFSPTPVGIIKTPEDAQNYDLIVFTGGEDISPTLYNRKNENSHGINQKRDEFELRVLNVASSNKKKMYGSCRGHQLLGACAFGLEMVQDLWVNLKTSHPGTHPLQWTSDNSNLYKFFKDKEVNSMHHQGLLSTSSRSKKAEYNGIIEIMESDTIISTQFHPEWLSWTKPFFKYLEEWSTRYVTKEPVKEHSKSEEEIKEEIREVLHKNSSDVEIEPELDSPAIDNTMHSPTVSPARAFRISMNSTGTSTRRDTRGLPEWITNNDLIAPFGGTPIEVPHPDYTIMEDDLFIPMENTGQEEHNEEDHDEDDEDGN